MLQKEKFNGRVLIFPLLEIEFQKMSVNLEKADILVFTSVYAAEKLYLELKNSETPIFAVGQRCNEFLREIGAKETFIFSNVKQLLDSLKDYCNNKRPTIFYLRGDEISFDLKADLSKYNFNCEEYVVYKQRRPVQQRELDNILARKHLEGIALFSEKSVDSLTRPLQKTISIKYFSVLAKKLKID